MSNNNPHGPINQSTQNPSWNPLQIPSYIPRQPQLAHMSNERPMVRSPLAWHAPAQPPDSIYNFMSANHKNLDHQMNPLLPPYVRGPSPFDSMDLSLQSSRNANSPLNKNNPQSTGGGVMPHQDYGHKQVQPLQQPQLPQHHQQQQQIHAQQNNYPPIHNLSTTSVTTTSSLSLQQRQHAGMSSIVTAPSLSISPAAGTSAVANTKYLNSNGSDCSESMLPPPPAIVGGAGGLVSVIGSSPTSVGNNNIAGSSSVHYMREPLESHINENYGKISQLNHSYENEAKSNMQKPIELVNKDCNYSDSVISDNKIKQHQPQLSPKKQSPIRNYHAAQQSQQSLYNSPTGVKQNGPRTTPPTAQSPVRHQSPSKSANNSSLSSVAQQQQPQMHTRIHSQAVVHSNNNADMDYNQLHLQQHQNYAQPQHMSSHLHHQQQQQQQQHIHYSHHHHHQQQQHQHQQYVHSQQHLHQQPQHTSTSHSQLQHLDHQEQHSSPLNPQHSTQLKDLVHSYPPLRTDKANISETNLDLSANTPSVAFKPAGTITIEDENCLPETAESPDTAASSNEESLDSNSNSNGCHQRQQNEDTRKNVRVSPNESDLEEIHTAPSQEKRQLSSLPSSSPQRSSPNRQRKTFRKSDNNTPLPMSPSISHQHTRQATNAPLNCQSEHQLQEATGETIPTLENGQPLEELRAADEVETLDKIAEMIAKTRNQQHTQNVSKGAPGNAESILKTKKQRQALKLKNSEHGSNSNCSTNSYENVVAINDNAVLAEELQKETKDATTKTSNAMQATSTGDLQPVSPQSNSRSSSSSSSSSSCSASSRSSMGCKIQSAHISAAPTSLPENAVGVFSVTTKENLSENTIQIPECSNMYENVDRLKQITNKDQKSVDDTSLNQLDYKKDITGSNAEMTPTKSCFEEVENKLEEMFAGIEDEPTPQDENRDRSQTPVNEAEVANDLSLALELSNHNGAVNATNDINVQQKKNDTNVDVVRATSPRVVTRVERPPPTKAAKKSTLPSPIKLRTPSPTQSPPVEATERNKTLPRRINPPRRRLSIAMDPASLRITMSSDANVLGNDEEKRNQISSNDHTKALIINLDEELPSTSAAAAAAETLNKQAAKTNGRANEFTRDDDIEIRQLQQQQHIEIKSAPKSRECSRTNGGKRRTVKSTKGNGSFSKSSKGGGKHVKLTKQQKQKRQQQRCKQNSSDDEGMGIMQPRESLSNADQKYKSPFILIKEDGNISVINAPTAEDVTEKQTKVKYAHDRKNIRGLHSSTLSNKYDADTTDSTWICVFCKRGPHKMGLGDLFGPYIVSIDCEEYKTAIKAPDVLDIDAAFVSKRRRIDMIQVHPRNLPVVPASTQIQRISPTAASRTGMNKKKKKSIDGEADVVVSNSQNSNGESTPASETFLGMCKISESNYEVWLHEDCTVWAPNIFLVGARIMGLDVAVWNSRRYHCVICENTGAMVCCLQRECKAAAHVPCAREARWNLNEAELKVHCHKHANANLPPSSSSIAVGISNAYSSTICTLAKASTTCS